MTTYPNGCPILPEWTSFDAEQRKEMREEMLAEAEKVLSSQGYAGGRLKVAASKLVDEAMQQERMRLNAHLS